MATNESTLINIDYITDTNTHTYRNDANFKLVGLADSLPQIRAFMIFVDNATDQQVTITPYTNVDNKKKYGDVIYSAIAQYTVNAGDQSYDTADFVRNPLQYLCLYATYTTAPSKGYLKANVYIY